MQLRLSVSSKWAPETVTNPRPSADSESAAPVTVGPTSYTYRRPSLLKSAPPLQLASTVTAPAFPTPGTKHRMEDDDTYWALPDAEANEVWSPNRHTKLSGAKPSPSSVTNAPPDTEPREGRT